MKIGEVCGRMHKRLSLEMGGKNAILVLEDADVDLAVDGAVWGAFGTSGQRCTASSRLIVQSKLHDAFVERMVDGMKKLKVDHALKEGTVIGPVVDENQDFDFARCVISAPPAR